MNRVIKALKKNYSLVLVVVGILLFRYLFLPLVGIVDISVILTNSMQHGKVYEYQYQLSVLNVPCCLIHSGPPSVLPINYPISNKTATIFSVRGDFLIGILKNLSRNMTCNLNDCNFYEDLMNSGKSFLVFEKKINLTAVFERFEGVPFEDGINPGDVVIVVRVNPCKDISPGDVIQYYYKGIKIVHRVVAKIPYNGTCLFVVKGDNTLFPIPQVETNITPKQILGKVVVRIPYLGILNYYLYSLLGFTSYPQKIFS